MAEDTAVMGNGGETERNEVQGNGPHVEVDAAAAAVRRRGAGSAAAAAAAAANGRTPKGGAQDSSKRAATSSTPGRLLLGVLATLAWMGCSSALIILNKSLYARGFRYPSTVTGMGQVGWPGRNRTLVLCHSMAAKGLSFDYRCTRGASATRQPSQAWGRWVGLGAGVAPRLQTLRSTFTRPVALPTPTTTPFGAAAVGCT